MYGRLFQIKYDEIDFSTNILNFVVDDAQIFIDLFKERIAEIDETHELENEDCNKNTATDVTNFDWNDASTKLFLNIYKCKKDLVSARKIKTYKLLWRQIAEDMGRNGYSVSPLQVENKFKSLTRSYKNMISNNKKTGRGRATCKFEAELTDLFAKKHNITPLALSGRNGLVLREDQNSEKENNALLNYSANNNNESENDLDEPSSAAGTSTNASNTLEKDKNPQKKSRASRATENDLDEPSCSVAGTVIASNTSEKNKNPQKMKSRARRTTTENLKECLVAIESFTSEMKTERESFHNMQVQMLEEYKNIKKLHEDYINSATERWAAASAQRKERNELLKEISKNCSDKEIFL
ncbi:uncharacterized protein LOC112468644 isoform X2 [Temnothorax curvispinosus]|uniref:Uncharacterized protein LOC112468644 isoform X2 n=1 Tax=Temnothorax curvispinosus TaxID=300111 RepID=A0A6J1RLW1_9HYME|nr:uncharacterized protein LOC112468644 isoform X2 [Temnothorax curvispinosus]